MKIYWIIWNKRFRIVAILKFVNVKKTLWYPNIILRYVFFLEAQNGGQTEDAFFDFMYVWTFFIILKPRIHQVYRYPRRTSVNDTNISWIF